MCSFKSGSAFRTKAHDDNSAARNEKCWVIYLFYNIFMRADRSRVVVQPWAGERGRLAGFGMNWAQKNALIGPF